MRNNKYTLRSKEVHEHAAGLLQTNLKLRDYSKTCTVQVLLLVLFSAAARIVSVFAACQSLAGAPSLQTILNALREVLPAYAELQRRVNRALAGDLPKPLRCRPQRIGIDLTLIPYHGRHFQDLSEIFRSQAKCGTSHFHAYASAYVICRGQRFTVGLTPVTRGEAMGEVVKRLIRLAVKAGVRTRLLLLDRGFYSIEVIRYLQCARVPFLMPAIARGRKPAPGQAATGIRAFRQRKRGCWGEHTLVSGKRRARIGIAVFCGNYRGAWKRRGRYAWVYAFWGWQPKSLRWVAETYRTRFGIESSYRQLHQARIRTCTRDPELRFFFVALALIVRNVWVWYHWEILSSPRRGARLLRPERLRFKTMLFWLLHVAAQLLNAHETITTERPPPKQLAAKRTASPR
jgi:putative transposase